MRVRCPECGSRKVRCIENGVEVASNRFKCQINGDCFMCGDCDERFVTGLGTDSKQWEIPVE